MPSDIGRNVYIDRSVTPRIETIVWRYIAAICVGGTIWVYERIQLNAILRQNKYQPELHWPYLKEFENIKFPEFIFSFFFTVRVYCSFERNIVMIVCVWNVV